MLLLANTAPPATGRCFEETQAVCARTIGMHRALSPLWPVGMAFVLLVVLFVLFFFHLLFVLLLLLFFLVLFLAIFVIFLFLRQACPALLQCLHFLLQVLQLLVIDVDLARQLVSRLLRVLFTGRFHRPSRRRCGKGWQRDIFRRIHFWRNGSLLSRCSTSRCSWGVGSSRVGISRRSTSRWRCRGHVLSVGRRLWMDFERSGLPCGWSTGSYIFRLD
mmetsp:Transcript_27530/g.56897  ORF Transcript_27530/g.56897 Transcript_27530/m.56897 type:complete len:218 (-) Transcript_27530:440-1093(-)